MPARALASEAIVFDRESRAHGAAGRRLPGAPAEAVDMLPLRGQDPGAVLLALLGSPNLSSRHPVFEQYDSNVQSNTVAAPGRGAAVLRIKGTTKALVATTDGNAPVGVLDPWLGAALSVAEAARNVSITGARPLGVTNCLNYGDPTRPEAFWQLAEGVRGLADACTALGLPVTGGNVSLYNEAPGSAIAPTPEIGIVGLLGDVSTLVGPAFRGDDNLVVLVGEPVPGLAGSEYARLAGAAAEDGPPPLDLERERSLQAFIREAIARSLVESCQDVSGGGFAVAVAEMCIWGDRGADLRLPVGTRRRSRCSARARRGSSARCSRPGCRGSSCSPATTASPCTSWARRAATASAWISPARAPREPRRSGGAGSRTPWTSPWRTCAMPGRRASRALSAGRAPGPTTTSPTPRSRAPRSPPDVRRGRGRPAQPRSRGGGGGRDGAVRPPAPGPGVGGSRRLGRGRT